MKVLVTRPDPWAAATAAALTRLGFEPIMLPCLRIEPLPAALPERPAAIILTSGQAVATLPARYQALPCFCVGDATAQRLREAGYRAVESAAGDAEDLRRLVVARGIVGPHLLAVGERHGTTLARQLREQGIEVLRREVYRTTALEVLPEAIRAGLAAGEIDAALFYSAETIKAFIRLRPPGTAQVTALALSPAVAAAAAGLPWREIRVALAPDEAHLLPMLT